MKTQNHSRKNSGGLRRRLAHAGHFACHLRYCCCSGSSGEYDRCLRADVVGAVHESPMGSSVLGDDMAVGAMGSARSRLSAFDCIHCTRLLGMCVCDDVGPADGEKSLTV